MDEDSTLAGISVVIDDVETTLTCASDLTAVSSDTTLVPATGLVIAGTAPNCTLAITPQANLYGTATITLEVSDGVLTGADTFELTVNSVNDAPTISDVADQNTSTDTPVGPISFTINDIDHTLTCTGSMTGSAANSTLLPQSGIVFSGTAPNCEFTLTP